MLNRELLDTLRKLDLNEYEAKAFLALSTHGANTAGELSEKAELPRPRIYDVLKGLHDKGFVVIKPGRPIKYSANSITEAIKTLKKHKQNQLESELKRVEEIGEGLNLTLIPNSQMGDLAKIEDTVWTIKGRDVLYNKMASMISQAKNHVLISSSPEGLKRKFESAQKELERAKNKGVKIQTVSHAINDKIIQRLSSFHTSKKLSSRFVVADDEALLFLSPDNTHPDEEVGIWIKNPHLANTFRDLIK